MRVLKHYKNLRQVPGHDPLNFICDWDKFLNDPRTENVDLHLGSVVRFGEVDPEKINVYMWGEWPNCWFSGRRRGQNVGHNFEIEKRFDYIVAIGSLHHTGNLLSSIKKCYNLLEKNGILIGMVYSAVSYRRWTGNFKQTLKLIFSKKELSLLEMDEDEKKKYDKNFLNQAPPATEFTTKAKMKLILNKFNEKKLYYENLNGFYPNYHITRKLLLTTFFPKIFGTDLYFLARKIKI